MHLAASLVDPPPGLCKFSALQTGTHVAVTCFMQNTDTTENRHSQAAKTFFFIYLFFFYLIWPCLFFPHLFSFYKKKKRLRFNPRVLSKVALITEFDTSLDHHFAPRVFVHDKPVVIQPSGWVLIRWKHVVSQYQAAHWTAKASLNLPSMSDFPF